MRILKDFFPEFRLQYAFLWEGFGVLFGVIAWLLFDGNFWSLIGFGSVVGLGFYIAQSTGSFWKMLLVAGTICALLLYLL